MLKNCFLLLALCVSLPALAHDTWVETNAAVVRAGDAVYVDLKLGNHGNHHRDFKLASKVTLEGCSLNVVLPDGRSRDLLPELKDQGYAPNEGFWQAKFVPMAAGTYVVSHQLDRVVNHGRPIRSIKSGKTMFLAAALLDRINDKTTAWEQPLGHPLEIVLQSHPVRLCGPGMPVRVQVLFRGEPLEGTRVSFVPQGVTLADDWDDTYERRTAADGVAAWTPRTGSRLLIVVHHDEPDERGDDYEATAYAATLTLLVPELCACCQ